MEKEMVPGQLGWGISAEDLGCMCGGSLGPAPLKGGAQSVKPGPEDIQSQEKDGAYPQIRV